MTLLRDLPREILEAIAIRAGSLGLAYLLESDYAGQRICKLACLSSAGTWSWSWLWVLDGLYQDQIAKNVYAWTIPWHSFYRKQEILRDSSSWAQRDQIALLQRIDQDTFCQHTHAWELAFRLRDVTNWKFWGNSNNNTAHAHAHAHAYETINRWLSLSSCANRGAFVTLCTGMQWCEHCNRIPELTSSTSIVRQHKCASTVSIQTTLKWQSPLNYQLVASYLSNMLLGSSIPASDTKPKEEKVRLNELLRLGAPVHTFVDEDKNWAIVAETNSRQRKIVSALKEVVSRLAKYHIESSYDICSELKLRSPYLCAHCFPSLAQIPRTRHHKLYVLRMKPLGTAFDSLNKRDLAQGSKPFGDFTCTAQ